MSLSPDQLDRHRRHILLKDIGGPGVQKLAAAHATLVGAGALGGPCAMYLAAAGVGRIELIDDDCVERSNLQRQIQFSEADIGAFKVDVLSQRLAAMNPDVEVIAHRSRYRENAALSGQVVIDATDNYETRFALNALAHQSGRYLVSGAAAGWSGQVSVFASGVDSAAPCYRCFVPESPPDAEACDEVGVVGPVTGLIASTMALEALKLITGAGVPLIGKVLIVDGLRGDFRTVRLRPNADCPVCGT